MSEFVKLGHDSGWIEVELKGKPGGKNHVIRRHLAKDSEKTSFTLDGRDATAQLINQTMAKLNVQVGNLCTFLPQDRVSAFSQMPPNELLKETQRAAGDPRLIEWQNWLINGHKQQKIAKDELDRHASSLKHKQDKQTQQEKEVKQFEVRRKLQYELDVLALMATYSEYTAARDEWVHSKDVKNQAEIDLKALEEANKPFKQAQEYVHSYSTHSFVLAVLILSPLAQRSQGQGQVLRQVKEGRDHQSRQSKEGNHPQAPRD